MTAALDTLRRIVYMLELTDDPLTQAYVEGIRTAIRAIEEAG